MSQYADLLKAVNSRLGYNAEDPERVDNKVDWKLNYATKSKCTEMSFEKKVESVWLGDVHSTADKTAAKCKISHGDGECVQNVNFANDKQAADVVGVLFNEDGWKGNLGMGGEIKQAKKEWKMTGSLDVTSQDFAGFKAAFASVFEYNQNGDITAKPKVNFELSDEMHLGASCVWDSKVSMKDIWGQLVYKPQGEDMWYWARFDKMHSMVMAGVNGDCKDCGLSASAEAAYCFALGMKGFYNQPVLLRGGYNKKFNDRTNASGTVKVGESYSIENTLSHKYDSNWTLSVTQSFDAEKVGQKKQTPYHIGFGASYKV